MSGLISDAAGLVGRGFDAWMDELGSFWPRSRLASRSSRAVDATVGVTPAGSLFLIEPTQRARKAPQSAGLDAEDDLVNYLGWLARTKPKATIRLRLSHGSYFERRLDIPAAAARQVSSILALNLERSTPFKATEVLSACALEPHSNKSKGLLARHFIAKRKLADTAISKIEALGLKVASIDCADVNGNPLPVDFLSVMPAETPRSRRWMMGLVALVGLAGSAFLIAESRRETALSGLEQEIVSARKMVERARVSSDKAAAIDKSIASIRALKVAQLPSVAVVNELTRLLPDDMSLETFKLDGDVIDMTGSANSAATLVTLIERSTVFKDAQLTAPVVPDAATGKERVSLRMKLRISVDTAPLGEAHPPVQVSP